MSDERNTMKASTRWSLLALFVALATLTPIAAWHLSRWFVAPPPYQPPENNGPPISTWDAEDIAIAEVKKREGWSGHAKVQGEGNTWFVYVFRDYEHRRSNARWVAVDTEDGHVTDYNSAN